MESIGVEAEAPTVLGRTRFVDAVAMKRGAWFWEISLCDGIMGGL